MIEFKVIEAHQIPEVKRVILTVAWEILDWDMSLDEAMKYHTERGTLHDVDEVQSEYLSDGGTFLVVLDNEQVVGSGAIRRIDDLVCELKRLWLLSPYQGRGIGLRLVRELFSFARSEEYKTVRLMTDVRQERAVRFYQRLGFEFVACLDEDDEDLCMEMVL